MKIEFDPTKSEKNIRERKLAFDKVSELDWATAVVYEDDRLDYPEQRLIALAFLGVRLHVLCFTPTAEGIRVISFRKANKREEKRYERARFNQR